MFSPGTYDHNGQVCISFWPDTFITLSGQLLQLGLNLALYVYSLYITLHNHATSCWVWYWAHNTMVSCPPEKVFIFVLPVAPRLPPAALVDHMTPDPLDKWFCLKIAFFFFLNRLHYGLFYANIVFLSVADEVVIARVPAEHLWHPVAFSRGKCFFSHISRKTFS